jgi:PPOX class probable F420-dependent enzyme
MTSGPTPSRETHGAAITREPLAADLLAAPLVASLATHDGEGRIHVVAMWFVLDGDRILLATGSRSRKLRNLQRDDRATLMVHDSRGGFDVRGICLQGRVDLVREPDARELVRRVHRKYVTERGAELAAEFLASDDVALVFRPERAFSWDETGSEAARVLREEGEYRPLLPTHPPARP